MYSPYQMTNGVAQAAPVTTDDASDVVVGNIVRTKSRRCFAPPPLAVRRPAHLFKSTQPTQRRVSTADLDRVRVALEEELASGAALSDAEIVDRVAASDERHPLVISIGMKKKKKKGKRALLRKRLFSRRISSLYFGRRQGLSTQASKQSDWRSMGRWERIRGGEDEKLAKKGGGEKLFGSRPPFGGALFPFPTITQPFSSSSFLLHKNNSALQAPRAERGLLCQLRREEGKRRELGDGYGDNNNNDDDDDDARARLCGGFDGDGDDDDLGDGERRRCCCCCRRGLQQQ